MVSTFGSRIGEGSCTARFAEGEPPNPPGRMGWAGVRRPLHLTASAAPFADADRPSYGRLKEGEGDGGRCGLRPGASAPR
jgi:hypothetical protein